jgi:hypothetical protein
LFQKSHHLDGIWWRSTVCSVVSPELKRSDPRLVVVPSIVELMEEVLKYPLANKS